MTDALAAFGVGAADLPSQADAYVYPPCVAGRVAHIDADFMSYQVSAETRDELDGLKPRKSFEDMQHNAAAAATHLMRLAGAEKRVLHVTPSGSNKGGRYEQAIQKEYQGNRVAKEKPEFLDRIRAYIVQELGGVAHLDQEADDGMAQANYAARGPGGAWGDSNLSVIMSRDKDLCMAPGLHCDPLTGEMHCVGDPFGTLYLDDEGSSTKLRGWGTKFFWAQCLMGDTADNIQGIPALPGRTHLGYKPTKAYQAVLDAQKANMVPEKALHFQQQLDALHGKTRPCGPVWTYDLLKDVQSNKDAFELVRSLFVALHVENGHQYLHWQTGEAKTPTQALLSDMQLLWMRRNKNPLDVVEWLKGK